MKFEVALIPMIDKQGLLNPRNVIKLQISAWQPFDRVLKCMYCFVYNDLFNRFSVSFSIATNILINFRVTSNVNFPTSNERMNECTKTNLIYIYLPVDIHSNKTLRLSTLHSFREQLR